MTNPETITIVSGLPRSGTSMMMRMLVAGGMAILADDVRRADEDNPRGYFELEKVKQLENESSWLVEARGKAVKIVSALLKHLPNDQTYKVIFMRRKMEEILASQREMLIRRGEPADKVSDEKMAELFQKHVRGIEDWLASRPNVDVIFASYNEVLDQPGPYAERINRFLGGSLDVEAMAGAVDRGLYRQKR